ncbi:type III-B CRISPR module RAMP protein Cmr6 [Celerinatantimonas sp. MCCC 1A17872]|uniref:type III-B CRISPR module RAMP protein Cmr6 n=1 Tax=Celerinatantimonas sp. MCCC 1A17872 TaxID=3177514 RepID=UPI0038C98927
MTPLRRQVITDLLREQGSDSINPSLWLQKGLPEPPTGNSTAKTDHLTAISKYTASPLYLSAFNRWFDLTTDSARFSQTVMTLEQRLLISLTGNGALETGCSLSRNYGMPYIPGSSVKGVVRAWAEQNLTADYPQEIAELFGTRDSDELNRVSGLVIFHDAWWIPFGKGNTESKPFVLDVVTTHHQAYYNGGQAEPSDKDSPIPNHQLAVQGSFLFVIEGKPEHIALCQTMLNCALADNGIGAKTSAGYGYFKGSLELLPILKKLSYERMMTPEEKKEYEIRQLSEEQIMLMFSKELNKTKKRDDFDELVEKVKVVHHKIIESWKNETKNSSKNRYKAYQFLKGKNE